MTRERGTPGVRETRGDLLSLTEELAILRDPQVSDTTEEWLERRAAGCFLVMDTDVLTRSLASEVPCTCRFCRLMA